MPIESLHTHTTNSDGKLSHKEMFELSESLGVSVVAFTDHDAVLTDDAIEYLKGRNDSKAKWISGIEISAATPKDAETIDKGSLHVVGLFVDPMNPALVEHCKKAQAARIVRMQKMVKNLQELGFTVSEEECLAASGGETVGRPHIVDALKTHPENQKILDNIREEMRKETEVNSEIREKYEKMMSDGEYQYPYVLFLSHDAYKPAYVSVEYAPDLDEAATLIRNAGGIISLAHYFTVKKKIPLEFLRKLMGEKRIDGVETTYGLWHLEDINAQEIENDKKTLKKYAEETGLLETGGPDAHRREDMEKYVALTDFSARSEGMTQKILDSGKVDKKWSSFP